MAAATASTAATRASLRMSFPCLPRWTSAQPTVILSRFGPPLAVVAVRRMVFAPAVSGAWNLTVVQVSQSAVALNACPATTVVPLTARSIGRFVVGPLAKRRVRAGGPADAALTANSTYDPATWV